MDEHFNKGSCVVNDALEEGTIDWREGILSSSALSAIGNTIYSSVRDVCSKMHTEEATNSSISQLI
jgi:hypothetical protein